MGKFPNANILAMYHVNTTASGECGYMYSSLTLVIIFWEAANNCPYDNSFPFLP